MTKWEYRVFWKQYPEQYITIDEANEKVSAWMNEIGKEGWEIIDLYNSNTFFRIWCKRIVE